MRIFLYWRGCKATVISITRSGPSRHETLKSKDWVHTYIAWYLLSQTLVLFTFHYHLEHIYLITYNAFHSAQGYKSSAIRSKSRYIQFCYCSVGASNIKGKTRMQFTLASGFLLSILKSIWLKWRSRKMI